jgi:hypothetical protein
MCSDRAAGAAAELAMAGRARTSFMLAVYSPPAEIRLTTSAR